MWYLLSATFECSEVCEVFFNSANGTELHDRFIARRRNSQIFDMSDHFFADLHLRMVP